jgi:hypothetical protein
MVEQKVVDYSSVPEFELEKFSYIVSTDPLAFWRGENDFLDGKSKLL